MNQLDKAQRDRDAAAARLHVARKEFHAAANELRICERLLEDARQAEVADAARYNEYMYTVPAVPGECDYVYGH
jgi:hypothetical protein